MDLDKHQKAAAEARESKIVISAAPGSGKTRTVVARFRFLVEELNCLPREIALLTFTRYAAGEMRERIGDAAGPAFIGTFHSLCLRIVRMYGRERGWAPSWLSIADEYDVDMEAREVLRECRVLNQRGKWRPGYKQRDWLKYKQARESGVAVDRRLAGKFDIAWGRLVHRLKAQNVMSYWLIIAEALELLKGPSAPEIRKHWRHLIVDECQDTDRQQFEIISLLDPETLCLTGDGDQAIFEWRNAAPHLFIAAAKQMKLYELPNSYRFGYNIGRSANSLIGHNTRRLEKSIEAIASNAGTVNVRHNLPYGDLVGVIQQEIGRGYKPEEMVILARRHKTLERMANELANTDIPYLRIGGTTDTPYTAEFRTVKAYLRLSINPKDRRAFMTVATAEHISTDRLWEVREEAIAQNRPFELAAIYGLEVSPDLDAIAERLSTVDPDRDYAAAVEYMRDIMRREALADVTELMEYLQLEAVQDRLKDATTEMVLCSIHAAKGLEWPCVFIIGLNAAQFPSPMSIREGRDEEERRLAFVALTRAKEKVYLVNAPPEKDGDGPSLFLDEIGAGGP